MRRSLYLVALALALMMGVGVGAALTSGAASNTVTGWRCFGTANNQREDGDEYLTKPIQCPHAGDIGPVGFQGVVSGPSTTVPVSTSSTPTTRPSTTTSPNTVPKTTTSVSTSSTVPSSTTVPPGLVFDDEFNGTSVDLSKWQPNWLAGNNTDITKPVDSSEISCYDPHQVSESGGNLVLTLAHRSCTSNQGVTYGWASGLVNSFKHFNFTNGSVEARVWLSGGARIDDWPAVWNGPGSAESDIMEGLGGDACWHYHPGSAGGCPAGTWTGWHTFGENVRGNVISYLYDGNLVGSTTVSGGAASRYLILNLGLHTPDSDHPAGVPTTMLIDYIRVSA